MRNYSDLKGLIAENTEASEYFKGLPDYVREMITDRGMNIHTLGDLETYADNLLSGDK